MTTKIFTTKLAIKTTLPKVWDALATETGLTQWFPSQATLDVRSGGSFEFCWGEFRLPGKFIEVIPQKKLSFTWWEPKGPITFELEKSGDSEVIVTLIARGYQSEGEELKQYIEETKGWTFFLTNLKSYLEHGIDLRDHNPARTCQTGWLNASG